MRNEFDILNDTEIDLSVYDSAELSEKERMNMKKVVKKKTGYRKFAVPAACICLLGIIAQTAFAQDFLGKIVKSISTGHNKFVEVDMSGVSAPMPEYMNGLVFDAEGNPALTYQEDMQYYDKNGKAIEDWDEFLKINSDAMGDEIRVEFAKKDKDPLTRAKEDGWLVIENIDEINQRLCFDAKLPEYLPEGFRFYGATVAEDSKYYLFLYYINDKTGKYFTIHERFMNEETAFEASSGGKIKETDIHGHKAVISGGNNVDWEQDGIAIGVSSRGLFSEEEVIKVANSIK